MITAIDTNVLLDVFLADADRDRQVHRLRHPRQAVDVHGRHRILVEH